MKTFRLSLAEIFFLQLIVWMAIWLTSDYVATLLTLCIGTVVLAILIVSLLAEWVERSKVPKLYFQVMGVSLLAILVAAIAYVFIFGGSLSFLERG